MTEDFSSNPNHATYRTLYQRDKLAGLANPGTLKPCCSAYASEKYHSVSCTSNEAVILRGEYDPIDKTATWKTWRTQHGDPLDRLAADLQSGNVDVGWEETPNGGFLSIKRPEPMPPAEKLTDITPDAIPINPLREVAETELGPEKAEDLAAKFRDRVPAEHRSFWSVLDDRRKMLREGLDEARKKALIPPVSTDYGSGEDMTMRHVSFNLCELCGFRQASRPRERETVLALFWGVVWAWEGTRLLLGANKRHQYTQIAWVGPFMLAARGPSWDEAPTGGRRWRIVKTWSLGRFFRTRPWLCQTCQVMGDVTRKRERGAQRQVWYRVLGRELRVFGYWLSR